MPPKKEIKVGLYSNKVFKKGLAVAKKKTYPLSVVVAEGLGADDTWRRMYHQGGIKYPLLSRYNKPAPAILPDLEDPSKLPTPVIVEEDPFAEASKIRPVIEENEPRPVETGEDDENTGLEWGSFF